jgi:VCBS repeat-containing protein
MLRNGRTLAIVVAVTVALGAGIVGLGLVASQATVPAAVQLHLGTDGRYFQFGTTTQALTTSGNSCAINSAEPVMHLTSTGTHSSPGLGTDSIGVRGSSNSNGTPCGQIDGTESLTLTPGTTIAGRSFSSLRFDLEMTGNAIVKLTVAGGTSSQVYQLQTGTAIAADQRAESDFDTTVPYFASSGPGDTTDACAAPNSSGPNSSGSDNCEWTVTPGFNFDHITLTTVSLGTVALEGSNDFGNNPAFNSMFFLSNGAPTPSNDTISTNEDTAVSGNVITNDTDPDGSTLTASLVSGPSHGTLSLASGGAFTYTPALNYNGPDSFVYAASDGSLSANATANITVAAVNDAPVANNDTAQVNQHESVTVDVTANDTDVEGDTLTPTNVANLSPAGSTAVVNADRTVTFTAPGTYTGPASFTYQASDGQASSNVATVNVTVFPAICSNDTVTATDGDASGSFTRLSDASPCKRYTLTASATDDSVLFQPTGTSTVDYRAVLSFGPDPTPAAPGTGPLPLRYDPTGATTYRLVPWCQNPQFDANDRVTSATIPAGDNWCIAQADTRPDATGRLSTTWQVFGQDDPHFTR